MSAINKKRVMWLLNHTTARKFEVSMLNAVGIDEIFLPKSFPDDPSFRTASIDFSLDERLSIPKADLDVFNQTNWYGHVPVDRWRLASRYFDIAFFLPMSDRGLEGITKHFDGAIVWRVYGRDSSANYDKVLNSLITRHGRGGLSLRRAGRRFFFGEAYPHLADIEPQYLRERRLYLPLGLESDDAEDVWEGDQQIIYFVCPEIATSPLYRKIYHDFVEEFGRLPYAIAGAQPIAVPDPRVLGLLSREEHARNMVRSRVMFYHSREPNHVHYHPFEAIRVGMPLVFLSGGMLDKLGGRALPGRCKTVGEAREKVERILDGDQALIERIRQSQRILLEPMNPRRCEPAWRAGLQRISSECNSWRAEMAASPTGRLRKRVAVVLPQHAGERRLACGLSVARALALGSRKYGEDAEIVLAEPKKAVHNLSLDPQDLQDLISTRTISWQLLSADEARRAMRYAGYRGWEPHSERYVVPNDGVGQLLDCDFWLFVGDQLEWPVLPIRPLALFAYDYSQRYTRHLDSAVEMSRVAFARSVDVVLVNTDFMYREVLQYAGVERHRIFKLPVLAPEVDKIYASAVHQSLDIFVMTIEGCHGSVLHTALEGLKLYYDWFGGQFDCKVIGTDPRSACGAASPEVDSLTSLFEGRPLPGGRVAYLGDLAPSAFHTVLASAAFFWAVSAVDNGATSVLEARALGIPTLAFDYPALKEIDTAFRLSVSWVDAHSAKEIAKALKMMETAARGRRRSSATLGLKYPASNDDQGAAYWKVVREWI